MSPVFSRSYHFNISALQMPLRQLNFEGEGRAITSAMSLGEVELTEMISLYIIYIYLYHGLMLFLCL